MEEGEGEGGTGEDVVLRFGRGMLKVSPIHRFANIDFVRTKSSNSCNRIIFIDFIFI